ncbi:MAG: acetyltransferase [Frankiales bacterium]|nr:acetyltransferase [Frankiales bacterium]
MGTLRRATPSDAAELTRLRGFMHLAMGDELTDQWRVSSTEVFARRLASEDFVAFLVEDDGIIVSGGAGWLEEHLSSPYALDPRRGHIASMSTDPGYRRRGYGRMVFGALMEWFAVQGVPRVDLRATEDGRPLYEEFGFTVLGGATMAWFGQGTRAGLQ